jgi:hypothetical protein
MYFGSLLSRLMSAVVKTGSGRRAPGCDVVVAVRAYSYRGLMSRVGMPADNVVWATTPIRGGSRGGYKGAGRTGILGSCYAGTRGRRRGAWTRFHSGHFCLSHVRTR